MTDWSQPKQLIELSAFYEYVRLHPDSISDEDFLTNITKAFWPTNCWSFVEASFAIIAPGCALRPHLARTMIKAPIEAMIAGGLDDPSQIVAQGIACATKAEHYVEPTDEGKQWLINEWPKMESIAKEIFDEIWNGTV